MAGWLVLMASNKLIFSRSGNKYLKSLPCMALKTFKVRMARLELARQSHTPLKRARIPIPPHPHVTYLTKKYVNLHLANLLPHISIDISSQKFFCKVVDTAQFQEKK